MKIKSILLLHLLIGISAISFGKKGSGKLKRMKLTEFVTGINSVAQGASFCNTTEKPNASCDILEYAFKIPHDLQKASQWVVYKGLDQTGPCLIIEVQRGHGKTYFKGKVFCANYCGWKDKELFGQGHITAELKNNCDQHKLEALSQEEAAGFVNGKQDKATINRIIVPQEVISQASYASGNDVPVYFHILLGKDIKSTSGQEDNLIMFDSLNKNGARYLGKKVFVGGTSFYQRGIVPIKLD